MSRLELFALALAAGLLAPAAGALGAVVHVEVRGIAFVPATVTAHVGDTVEWTNHDFVAHTASARKGDWDVNLPVGKTGEITLKSPGVKEYYCRVHPNMTGKIEVTGK